MLSRSQPSSLRHLRGGSQALAAVICEPGVNTTEGMLLRDLLQEAAALGRPLFTLFDHPAGAGRPSVVTILSLPATKPALVINAHLLYDVVLPNQPEAQRWRRMPVDCLGWTKLMGSSALSLIVEITDRSDVRRWSSRGVIMRHVGRVVDGAALVMRAVAEGGTSSAAPMREAALGEGAMLHHLAIAVGGKARRQPRATVSICPHADVEAADATPDSAQLLPDNTNGHSILASAVSVDSLGCMASSDGRSVADLSACRYGHCI